MIKKRKLWMIKQRKNMDDKIEKVMDDVTFYKIKEHDKMKKQDARSEDIETE